MDRDRLLGLAILPATTIDDAIDELRRVSTMPGIRGVVLHVWPNGSGTPDLDVDERFWKLAVELDVPITADVSFGGGAAAEMAIRMQEAAKTGESLMNFAPINAMLSKVASHGFVANQLITSGVFERVPELQFFFAETQVGWIPEFMEDADENYASPQVLVGPRSPAPAELVCPDPFQLGLPDRPLRVEGPPRHRCRPHPVVDRLPARAVRLAELAEGDRRAIRRDPRRRAAEDRA